MNRKNLVMIDRVEAIVKPISNTGHVTLPKSWIGKKVIVRLAE